MAKDVNYKCESKSEHCSGPWRDIQPVKQKELEQQHSLTGLNQLLNRPSYMEGIRLWT